LTVKFAVWALSRPAGIAQAGSSAAVAAASSVASSSSAEIRKASSFRSIPRTPCRHQLTRRMKAQLCMSPASHGERGRIGKILAFGALKGVAIAELLNH
jgi:hypothetical protein